MDLLNSVLSRAQIPAAAATEPGYHIHTVLLCIAEEAMVKNSGRRKPFELALNELFDSARVRLSLSLPEHFGKVMSVINTSPDILTTLLMFDLNVGSARSATFRACKSLEAQRDDGAEGYSPKQDNVQGTGEDKTIQALDFSLVIKTAAMYMAMDRGRRFGASGPALYPAHVPCGLGGAVEVILFPTYVSFLALRYFCRSVWARLHAVPPEWLNTATESLEVSLAEWIEYIAYNPDAGVVPYSNWLGGRLNEIQLSCQYMAGGGDSGPTSCTLPEQHLSIETPAGSGGSHAQQQDEGGTEGQPTMISQSHHQTSSTEEPAIGAAGAALIPNSGHALKSFAKTYGQVVAAAAAGGSTYNAKSSPVRADACRPPGQATPKVYKGTNAHYVGHPTRQGQNGDRPWGTARQETRASSQGNNGVSAKAESSGTGHHHNGVGTRQIHDYTNGNSQPAADRKTQQVKPQQHYVRESTARADERPFQIVHRRQRRNPRPTSSIRKEIVPNKENSSTPVINAANGAVGAAPESETALPSPESVKDAPPILENIPAPNGSATTEIVQNQ